MTARRRSLLYLEKLRLLHAAFTIVLTVGLLAWAIVLWQRGLATTGDVVLVCTLGLPSCMRRATWRWRWSTSPNTWPGSPRRSPTLLVPHELRDHPEAEPLVERGAAIEFEQRLVPLSRRPKVFENSPAVEPGQRVGLVGHRAAASRPCSRCCSASTTCRGGRILIDGQDIAKVTQDSLRDAIAVVPQDISLFHRSVMENIRYGRPEATDDEVLRAALAARCDFIESLPNGFDTIVGDRGVKLSGGQRQRIAIARAFLKDAPILLLDEATSALDSESEEAIREALVRLMRGRTVIAIAHRLSTLRNFDRIVVLEAAR